MRKFYPHKIQEAKIKPNCFLFAFILSFSLVPSFPQWKIEKKGYSIQINEKGILCSFQIHQAELLRSPLEFCPGIEWKAQIKKQTEEELAFDLTSEKGKGEILYRFQDGQLRLTLLHKLGGFQSWQVHFNDDVVAFENLQNNTVKGAEAIQYLERGEIRSLPAPFLARVQRARLYLKNGAQVLFWHSGWGAPFNLDEIGSINRFTYRRNLLENDKPMDIYFRIEKPPSQPIQPAPAFVPYGEVAHNLFYLGEPICFRIQFTEETIERFKQARLWRLRWVVKDFWDKEVTKGEKRFEGETALRDKVIRISFRVNGQGWFSILFSLTPLQSTSPPFIPSEFRTRFAVVKDSPAFPKRVPPSEQYNMSDYYYSALLGLKCLRESHSMSDFFPEKGKVNWEALDRIFENADKEARKWGINWFFQANSRPRWCSEADYEEVAFELVDRYKDKCKIWEVENEPNFSYSPQDYIQKVLLPFAKGAKRADPSCQIIAPACVSVHHTLRFLEAMLHSNALKYVDGISTHTYPGPGEPWEMFGNPFYLKKIREMTRGKPLWQTEQGYWWDNVSKQKFTRYVVRQFLNALAVGIPMERHFYYYVVHHGFEPMYLVEMGSSEGQNGTLEPAGIALRIMSEEIGEKKPILLEEPMFGLWALHFSGKLEDTVVIWTLDFPLKLQLQGNILGAEDIMGNPKKLKREGDVYILDVDGYPSYVRVQKGEKLRIIAPKLGKNWASKEEGAEVFASSSDEHHPPQNIIDGKWFTLYPTPLGQEEWIGTFWEAEEEGASQDKPTWLVVKLRRSIQLRHLILLTPLPAITAVPRDFQIQISDEGKNWQTIAKVENSEEWVYFFSFPSSYRTRFIRLFITKLNDGWHLDGRWMFMVSEDFKKYTNLRASVLEMMAFGD